ncbi:MAG: AbrB/MazE/SpoVT family DNA-binding domain-containing protein [Gemmatimonadaceae bacterium]|jgi:antitoxin PrlF|nr:AbrB/MazE/SpoVT family DNA-binding domain-containing protein [Gemmatimonadaceae bacterium]
MTSKYQATVPRQVREVLGVGAGDRIEFVIEPDGVRLRKATRPDPETSALDATLAPEWNSEADDDAFRDL